MGRAAAQLPRLGIRPQDTRHGGPGLCPDRSGELRRRAEFQHVDVLLVITSCRAGGAFPPRVEVQIHVHSATANARDHVAGAFDVLGVNHV